MAACGLEEGAQDILRTEEELSGCRGGASSTIPSSGAYVLTTFGASGSDDGIMSCGSYTRHGSWYYAASRQRYGCGARIKVEAGGRCVVAQTDDYGPDLCVERAAGRPILDASPLVAQHLFSRSGAGWSDRLVVQVTEVPAATPLGPCRADPSPSSAPSLTPGSAAGDCSSATLGMDVPRGTCVQRASDRRWMRQDDGGWTASSSTDGRCAARYAWCRSVTLGRDVPPRTCVQSAVSREWFQCTDAGWSDGVANGDGPLGTCAAEYGL